MSARIANPDEDDSWVLVSSDYFEFEVCECQHPDGRIEFTAQVEYAPDETLGRGATPYEAIIKSSELLSQLGFRLAGRE